MKSIHKTPTVIASLSTQVCHSNARVCIKYVQGDPCVGQAFVSTCVCSRIVDFLPLYVFTCNLYQTWIPYSRELRISLQCWSGRSHLVVCLISVSVFLSCCCQGGTWEKRREERSSCRNYCPSPPLLIRTGSLSPGLHSMAANQINVPFKWMLCVIPPFALP